MENEKYNLNEMLRDIKFVREQLELLNNSSILSDHQYLLLDIPAVKIEIWIERQLAERAGDN